MLRAGRPEGAVRQAAVWTAVTASAAVAGLVVGVNLLAGLAVAVMVFAFGIFVLDPIVVAVIVLPGAILIQRVGGSGTNLSVADLLVFVAAVVCLFQVEWANARHLKSFLRGVVWYQAVLILIVAAHPFPGDIIEWVHRWSYVAGSTLVGWVVAYNGRARQALRLYLWGSSALAVLAIGTSISLHFQPASSGVYQKNAIGAVMWIAIVIAQLNPPWARIPKVEARVLEVLCLLGLLASQSRQSAILLVLALGVAALLNSGVRGNLKAAIFIGAPTLALVYYSVTLAFENNPQFNSVAIRVSQLSSAIHEWHLSPVLGLGLRFYNQPQFIDIAPPPNSLVDNLTSTGVIGSLAFFFMVVVTLVALARLPRAYGTLGLVILLGHYVDGLFDIFWIGALSIPSFVIAGISLGMADADPTAQRTRDPSAEPARAGTGTRPTRAIRPVAPVGWGPAPHDRSPDSPPRPGPTPPDHSTGAPAPRAVPEAPWAGPTG